MNSTPTYARYQNPYMEINRNPKREIIYEFLKNRLPTRSIIKTGDKGLEQRKVEMPKHNARGRSNASLRHVRLYFWLLNSEAFRALSTVERCTLLELYKRYNGTNNGYIHVSNREIAKELHVSKTTAGRAVKKLIELGFAEITLQGSFSQKIKQATEYRLTEHRCDRTNQLAKKSFMRWRLGNKEKLGFNSELNGP